MRIALLMGMALAVLGSRSSYTETLGESAQAPTMGKCRPVSMRHANGDEGCWILSDRAVGALGNAPVFWYVDRFASRDEADRARTNRGVVVDALGKTWLLTIERSGWKSAVGQRVSVIGPLPIDATHSYSAQFMEAITNPGWTSEIHRHPGPEAWYTEGGETCLETPRGVFRGRPGAQPVIVPGGIPMHLTATGSEQRRALVLVLHDSDQPAGIMLHDWTPKGLCNR